jgi:hypothetical protein
VTRFPIDAPKKRVLRTFERLGNLGVEAGQLTVIGIALALFGLPFREKIWYRSRIVVPASIAIAAVGFYWSVERVLIR